MEPRENLFGFARAENLKPIPELKKPELEPKKSESQSGFQSTVPEFSTDCSGIAPR